MYSVSNAYKLKMLDKVQTHRLIGVLDGDVVFDENEVIGVSKTGAIAQKSVNIGGVNISTLKLTFLSDLLNRGSYYGKSITLSDGLLIGYDENEDPIYEDVPLGEFFISEATWSAANMIDITAYDCLSKLDKTLTIDQSSGKIYNFCMYIASETGTTFGLTEEECDLLPNGQEIISPYENNDLKTFRDLLSSLAQLVGGYAYADRDGSWKIRSFDNNKVLSIPRDRRMSGTKFSDYETYYDTVTYTEIENNIVRVVGDAEGLTMNIGSHPFLQYGTNEAIYRRVSAIVNTIKEMTYTPYEVSVLPALIALDLGDVIEFTDDYSSGLFSGAIMGLNYTYNKAVKLSCYGDNPNLRSAQSKTDKNISGIVNRTSQNEVTYHNFTNVDDIHIEPETETQIASLRFSAAQETTVKILHEFVMDMVADLGVGGSYELKYYLDDELVSYSPYERFPAIGQSTGIESDFSISRDFFYILREVQPNTRHSWVVTITTHDMSMDILTNHAHITLEGQRLYGETYFDGFIEAEDFFGVYAIGNLTEVAITDEAIVAITNAATASATDSISLCEINNIEVLAISEGVGELAPHIFMRGGFDLMTEDENNFSSEDGLKFITE